MIDSKNENASVANAESKEAPLTVKDFTGEENSTSVEDKKSEEKENKTETKEETTSVVTRPSNIGGDNGPQLKNLTDDFVTDIMSVPAVSYCEYRMVTYLILWCRKHKVNYQFDKKGNMYLTKGTLKEGEYYPCLTSHLDTVQDKQESYAEVGLRLPIKHTIDTATKKHKLSVDGMGIGADCRAGVAISLAIIEKFDVIKAAFFLEEEVGMRGSQELDKEWFKDVGYVIGYDSPELNRAAYKSSSTLLFSKAFFEEHLEEICKKHGLTKFNAEPFTDVNQIRLKTNITCMNFGNGGYNAHSSNEYVLLEDMDVACGMGIELVEHLGRNFYEGPKSSYLGGEDDESFFRSKFAPKYGGGYGGYSGYGGAYHSSTPYQGSSSTSGATTASTTSAKPASDKKEGETVPVETVKYISEKYEEFITSLQKKIEDKCEELGIDSEHFSSFFNEEITF